jgi:transcriptional regulator with XRE-family HTH domain
MSAPTDYDDELAALLEAFGDNIRELRENGLPESSQEDVAGKAKLHRTEWGKIERGKCNPRLSTLLVVADTLDVTLDDLAEGIDPPVHRKPSPNTKKRTSPAPKK